jgi:hypothetical protein
MYPHPQDEAFGPERAAEALGPLEPIATTAGDDADDAPGGAAGAARRPSHVTLLLAEIARAMQAAAAHERERIHAGVGEDEGAQIEKVRARAVAEAAALRKGADDDVRLVETWCDEEIRRIRAEADRRVAERRVELDQSVTQHGLLIETEVQSVHGAVAGYRESLDAFFARLAEAGDPSAIAGLAGTLPDPPDLDAVRADARSRAMKQIEEEASAQETASTAEASAEAAELPQPDGEAVPVIDPGAVIDPVPVMDPGATSSHDGVAARVIRSLANRTPPPQALR